MIFELNNSLANIKSAIDPYTFIEIVLLKYFPGNNSNNVSRETSDMNSEKSENICDLEKEQDNTITDNLEAEVTENNNTNKCSFNKNIRINNCFANAKKNYLENIKEKWRDFLIYESNANKTLMSYIVDTDIVVASDKYAILSNSIDSTSKLINDNITSLENDFSIFYGMKYKIVCLNEEEWNENKEKYIFNIKNNIKYSIIEEAEDNFLNDPKENENVDELEKLAAEIFDNKVEIK